MTARNVGQTTDMSPPGDVAAAGFRVGHGFDLHRLEEGRKLIVGGLAIDSPRGCAAHSDGDLVFHAVTDAILGALGQDDIGVLFPDHDPHPLRSPSPDRAPPDSPFENPSPGCKRQVEEGASNGLESNWG